MIANWLVLIGGALQVGGIAITFRGAAATWREFSPDEYLSSAILNNLNARLTDQWVWVKAKFGQPTPVRLASTDGPPALTIGGRGHLTVGYAELESVVGVRDALAELDLRSRELKTDLNNLSKKLFSELPQADHRLTALESGLDRNVAILTDQDRRIAVGGIQSILAGLILVGLGVILQSVSVLA